MPSYATSGNNYILLVSQHTFCNVAIDPFTFTYRLSSLVWYYVSIAFLFIDEYNRCLSGFKSPLNLQCCLDAAKQVA